MNHYILGLLLMGSMDFTNIVTADSPDNDVLIRKTEDILPSEMDIAREIGEKLLLALKPYGPAAGLAAPQIGISRSVFIFSYDRDPDHLEVVINPTCKPVEGFKVEGWEGCFSVPLKLAKIPRFEKVDVSYLTLDGDQVEKRLEGFAAKVFQHEYDHLQGIKTTDRDDAIVKEFPCEEAFMQFLHDVKKEDSKRY